MQIFANYAVFECVCARVCMCVTLTEYIVYSHQQETCLLKVLSHKQ